MLIRNPKFPVPTPPSPPEVQSSIQGTSPPKSTNHAPSKILPRNSPSFRGVQKLCLDLMPNCTVQYSIFVAPVRSPAVSPLSHAGQGAGPTTRTAPRTTGVLSAHHTRPVSSTSKRSGGRRKETGEPPSLYSESRPRSIHLPGRSGDGRSCRGMGSALELECGCDGGMNSDVM